MELLVPWSGSGEDGQCQYGLLVSSRPWHYATQRKKFSSFHCALKIKSWKVRQIFFFKYKVTTFFFPSQRIVYVLTPLSNFLHLKNSYYSSLSLCNMTENLRESFYEYKFWVREIKNYFQQFLLVYNSAMKAKCVFTKYTVIHNLKHYIYS